MAKDIYNQLLYFSFHVLIVHSGKQIARFSAEPNIYYPWFKSYDKGGIIVDSMTKQSTLYILTCQVLSIIDETANYAKIEMSKNFFELSL